MVVESSLAWPLVLKMPVPIAGTALVGSTPFRLSPDLTPTAWVAGTGTIAPAFDVTAGSGTWRNPTSPTFLCSVAGTASVTLPLVLGANRGLAVYMGFGCFRAYNSDGTGLPAYMADPGIKLELLDTGGAAVASLTAKAGTAESFYDPAFSFGASAIGADTVAIQGDYPGNGYWRNPWLRTVSLAFDADGTAEAGFYHPGASDPSHYEELGVANLAAVASLRLTVTETFGLTCLQIHKTGMQDAGPPGIWWRNRVYSIEQGTNPDGQPGDDWDGVS